MPAPGASGDAIATLSLDESRSRAEGHDHELARGTVVGRYVVLSRLGAGAMGVVYAAYDPELNRKVALKLLLTGDDKVSDSRSTDGRTRLLREAQALARLSHPNVVAVHDVGTHDDRVWIAMEFIDGRTLRAWTGAGPRAWPEVLHVMVAAGRGVAAAHAAGLLHRDLKPDNIMVAEAVDGTAPRVCVMDFGLARPREHASDTDPTLDAIEQRPKVEALAIHVTQAGAMLGTPAYMAPEQFRGEAIVPATDQFSFCVTLWEALFGHRPFRGESLVELAYAVLHGERRPPPEGRRVPGWLRRVVERGLEPDPARRWPSMNELLDVLARARARSRRRSVLAVGTALAVAGLGVAGLGQLDRRAAIAECEAEGAAIEEVWNPTIRADLRVAMLGSGLPYAEASADRALPWLDEHADAWRSASTEACLDATVRAVWSEDLRQRSALCLADRRIELEALVAALSIGEVRSINNAVHSAATLDQVEPCRDAALLDRMPVPPLDRTTELAALRGELARARALSIVGGSAAAGAALEQVLADAERLGWAPLTAAAREALGKHVARFGDAARAERLLEDAYIEAAKAGAAEVATEAAEHLVFVLGHQRGRHDDALHWSKLAEITLLELSDRADTWQALHLSNLGTIDHGMADYPAARTHYEQALAQYEAEERHGLDVARVASNLATVLAATGEYAAAKERYEQTLAIEEDQLGPEHPDVAAGLNNLAITTWAMGDYAASRALHERAVAIREKAFGPDHPTVAMSLNNLGLVVLALGDPTQAIALYERALAIREKEFGRDHPEVAATLSNLGAARIETGDMEAAVIALQRSSTILEQALGKDHPHVAYPLVGLARIAVAQGRPLDAVAFAERALAPRERASAPPDEIAEARFLLAQGLWESEQDRPRARELARAAMDAYAKSGDARADEIATIRAWLESRSGRP